MNYYYSPQYSNSSTSTSIASGSRRDLQILQLVTSPAIETDTRSVNASDAWFNAAVKGIFTALLDRATAASNATRKYFATGEMDFVPKLYGLAQCVPDLTLAQCRDCLQDLLNIVMTQDMGGQPSSNSAYVVWCTLIYSVSPVYDGRAMLQLAAPPAPPPSATLTPPSSGADQLGHSIIVSLLAEHFFQSSHQLSHAVKIHQIISSPGLLASSQM